MGGDPGYRHLQQSQLSAPVHCVRELRAEVRQNNGRCMFVLRLQTRTFCSLLIDACNPMKDKKIQLKRIVHPKNLLVSKLYAIIISVEHKEEKLMNVHTALLRHGSV